LKETCYNFIKFSKFLRKTVITEKVEQEKNEATISKPNRSKKKKLDHDYSAFTAKDQDVYPKETISFYCS
jgi:hypothetical protein